MHILVHILRRAIDHLYIDEHMLYMIYMNTHTQCDGHHLNLIAVDEQTARHSLGALSVVFARAEHSKHTSTLAKRHTGCMGFMRSEGIGERG